MYNPPDFLTSRLPTLLPVEHVGDQLQEGTYRYARFMRRLSLGVHLVGRRGLPGAREAAEVGHGRVCSQRHHALSAPHEHAHVLQDLNHALHAGPQPSNSLAAEGEGDSCTPAEAEAQGEDLPALLAELEDVE